MAGLHESLEKVLNANRVRATALVVWPGSPEDRIPVARLMRRAYTKFTARVSTRAPAHWCSRTDLIVRYGS